MANLILKKKIFNLKIVYIHYIVHERTVSSSFAAPFILSKIDISTEWLGTFKQFFGSISSLTYHRLNKAIWSFIPFLLFFVYTAKVLNAITAHPPGRITNLCIEIIHLQTLSNFIIY